jgi:hypothetical protein
VEVPVLKDGQIKRLEKFADRMYAEAERHGKAMSLLWGHFDEVATSLSGALLSLKVRERETPSPAGKMPTLPERISRSQTAVTARPTTSPTAAGPGSGVALTSADGDSLPPRRQRILDALLFFESLGHAEAAREWIAFFCDTSPNSSTYEKDCGAMRSGALINYPAPGRLQLRDEGRAIARATEAITLPEFHAKVERLLPPRRQKIVRELINLYPEALYRGELAERTGTSAASSTFEKDLGGMRTAGLLVYPQPNYAKAADLLFPPLPA